MKKIDKFVICWYSKIVFNTLNNYKKRIFRKLESETRKLTAEKLHQKFNEIYIYIYIFVKIGHKFSFKHVLLKTIATRALANFFSI